MRYYVSCTSTNSNTAYNIYDGMSQADITTLLTNLGATDIQFLDENTFKTEAQARPLNYEVTTNG